VEDLQGCEKGIVDRSPQRPCSAGTAIADLMRRPVSSNVLCVVFKGSSLDRKRGFALATADPVFYKALSMAQAKGLKGLEVYLQ